MADVFISYSHRDQQFALQLTGALAQREYTTWFDKNDVFPAGDFREDIKASIEEAGAFIFVLSPDSLLSEECNKELKYAEKCGKKLIPLHYRHIDPARAPLELRNLSWIEEASFDRMLEMVLHVLRTDKEDWQQAGRWLRLSNQWEKEQKSNSGLLLHGKELRKAEDWLKKAERWRLEGKNKQPQPQPSHIKFIRESRRTANRSFLVRIIVIVLFVGFTGAGALWLLRPPDPTRVTNLNDNGQGSLRWCLETAPKGSTITFGAGLRGAIILQDNLDITKSLTIRGPGRNAISINGNNKDTFSNNTYPSNAYFSVGIARNASVSLYDLSFQVEMISNYGTLTIQDSTFSNGMSNWGRLNLTKSTILATNQIALDNFGNLSLASSKVSGNDPSGSGFGGGIENERQASAFVINSLIFKSNALDGGGISNLGMLTIVSSTISDNTASGKYPGAGGGIWSGENASLTLVNSTIARNTASGNSDYLWSGGGGIYDDGTGTLRLINSTLSGNTADGSDGGGLKIDWGNFNPFNLPTSGTVDVIFCSISQNMASTSGGGMKIGKEGKQDQIVIRNTIVGGNQALHSPDISGSFASEGYNLIQNSAGTTFIPSKGDQVVPDFSHVFPSSVDLGNHGGLTQTLALLTDPQNPALDAIPLSSCQIKEIFDNHSHLYTDQRGMKRPGGKKAACDIGAYESQA